MEQQMVPVMALILMPIYMLQVPVKLIYLLCKVLRPQEVEQV